MNTSRGNIVNDLLKIVNEEMNESIKVISENLTQNIHTLIEISQKLSAVLKKNGTIYLCGNGGSAADAQHVAAEMVGRFGRDRKPLPAVALTTNTSIITALGNDFGFEQIFVRQVQAFLSKQDA